MISKKIVYVCFLIFSITTQAQNKSLKSVLVEIEKKHNVKFTYSDSDIANVTIKKPAENLSLPSLINYLNNKTFLNFKTLNKRYITVSFTEKLIPICGIVKDSQTLNPLSLATVKINSNNTGVSTNSLGEFYFKEAPSSSALTISFIGYNSITLPISNFFNTPCNEVFLTETSEELSEIIIFDFLTTGLQKNIDGSTTLNTDKFGILPGLIEPDILKTIKVLPGIESVNESIANINIRGGTNDQNLMLWDGIKMYHTGHFFGLISAYNPYLTKKAKVVKNGTSSQFSDGVSSTVNMTTDDEITHTFSGGAGFNLLSADAYIQVPITNKLELHASARRSFTDVLNTPTYSNYLDRSFQENSITANSEQHLAASNFYFYDYSFKILYDINHKHSLRANLINIKNNLKYTEEYISNNNIFEENSSLKQENLGANISWKALWSNRFTTQLSAFVSEYTINSSDYNRDSDQLQTQFNNVLETEIKLQSNYRLSDALNITNGAVFNEIGVSNKTTVNAPTYSKSVKNVLLKSALFSELEYKKNNTYARIGVRANYLLNFNQFLIEPRINVRQKVANNMFLKLEGELKNQTTTQKIDFQDNFLGIEKRRWVLADNNNTPIIKSKQVSLGTEYSTNGVQLNLTGFYKFVDGITVANQGFYNNVQTFNSIGSYDSKGVEFLINKKSKNLSTWLSYTFTKNNYTFNNFTPSMFPSSLDITHSVSAAVNYKLSSKIKLSSGLILRSGTPYTTPVEGNETIQNGNRTSINYDSPNKKRQPNFFKVNTSASYNFNFSEDIKSTIRVGFTNITNRRNVINTYYVIDDNDTTKTKELNTFSLPFTPNLSFRINF